jgi:membrane protein YqaA with SNARE-associated domain
LIDLLILFAWSFAASTILPLSSEIPLAVAVRRSDGWLLPVVVATAGNYLGACTTYWLAKYATDRAAPAPSRRLANASRLISRYGAPALLLSWVPLIGDALVALAGVAHMPFLPFSFWTIAGKAARYAAVAWLVGPG